MLKGQSLSEYSLAIGLIAIACIGGLVAFGGDLGGGLENARFHIGVPDAEGRVAGVAVVKADSDAIFEDPESIESIALSVDPITGELIYQISRNGGVGTQVTSEEGGAVTNLLAQQLEKLAGGNVGSEPMPKSISNLIRRLAAAGKVMSGVSQVIESNAEQVADAHDRTGTYPAPLVSTGLRYSETYLNFSKTYRQLKKEVIATYPKGSPERQSLMRQIDQLAGPISYIANKETGDIIFSEDFKLSKVDKAYVMKRQPKFPTAVNTLAGINSTIPHSTPTSKKDAAFQDKVRVMGDQNQVGTAPTGEGMAIKLDL